MLLKELEIMAARNEPTPKGLTPPQVHLYLSLVLLYRLYRLKVYTKKQASAEKLKVMDAYEMELLHWRIYAKAVQKRERLSPIFREMAESECESCKKVVKIITEVRRTHNDKF